MVAKYITTGTQKAFFPFIAAALPLRRGAGMQRWQACRRANSRAKRAELCEQKEGGLSVTDMDFPPQVTSFVPALPISSVCVLDKSHPESTHFWLVYIELPKDHDKTERRNSTGFAKRAALCERPFFCL